jgi:hypothetical protein
VKQRVPSPFIPCLVLLSRDIVRPVSAPADPLVVVIVVVVPPPSLTSSPLGPTLQFPLFFT